jgi:hypothetical protein
VESGKNSGFCAPNGTKPEKNRKKPVETRENPLTLTPEKPMVKCGTFPCTRINTGELLHRAALREPA